MSLINRVKFYWKWREQVKKWWRDFWTDERNVELYYRLTGDPPIKGNIEYYTSKKSDL